MYTCYTTHAVLQGLSVSISMVSIADTVLTFAKTSIPYNEVFSRNHDFMQDDTGGIC